ncbi:MAG: hypothetical protein KJN77_04630, partial [Gammaproteobacteria bacterium]|nr:hypothetical protein [Gammaproteobacteria bacterium]
MSRNPIFSRPLYCLLAMALLASGTSAVAEDDAALEEARATIAAKFDTIAPENIKRSPVDGWFEIQKGSIVAYVSEDGRYLLQGDLIDLDSQVNLSENSRNGARHDLVAALSDEETI